MGRRKRKIPGAPPQRARPTTPPPADNPATAFPAPAQTPGQAASRSAYEQFQAQLSDMRPGTAKVKGKSQTPECSWETDYLALRDEGWDWRKAAYIAWAASPATRRWPPTQRELATQVLGLKSDRVVRKWRDDDPKIDQRVAKLQVEPLLRHRRDVLEALIVVAKDPDYHAHQDRRLFLEMTGDYQPKGTVAMTGAGGGPVDVNLIGVIGEMDDAQLEQFIRNCQAAEGGAGGGVSGTATPAGA
jgi:hypothetical protein